MGTATVVFGIGASIYLFDGSHTHTDMYIRSSWRPSKNPFFSTLTALLHSLYSSFHSLYFSILQLPFTSPVDLSNIYFLSSHAFHQLHHRCFGLHFRCSCSHPPDPSRHKWSKDLRTRYHHCRCRRHGPVCLCCWSM